MTGSGEQDGDADCGAGDEPGAVAEPAAELEGGEGLPPVLAMLAQIRELAQSVIVAAKGQHTNEQSVTALREGAFAARQVDSAFLSLVADMDSRTGTVPGAPVGFEARAFIKHELHRTHTQAKADVAAANALKRDADPAKGGLPRLGEAFANGEVSREHVDAAVRMIGTVPKSLLGLPAEDQGGNPVLSNEGRPMCAGDVIDERITQHAKEYDSYALNRLAKELQDVVDPDGSRNYDPDSCLRRRLTLRQDYAGMWVLRGELPPADGARLKALLDHLSKPATGDAEDENGKLIKVPDARSTVQRYADALGQIAEHAATCMRTVSRGGEPPRVTVITRAEDLAAARAAGGRAGAGSNGRAHAHDGDGGFLGTGEHISPALLAQLSCDAILQRALLAPGGAILDLGREIRTITPAQRRALTARDRGCVIYGCTAPAYLCEGHHIRWWSHGGDTDIANLALVCKTHHAEIHTGAWILEMHDGVPWVRPPDWLSTEHGLLRNRFHDDVQSMRDYGTQLRLHLDTSANDPPPVKPPPAEGDPPSQSEAA